MTPPSRSPDNSLQETKVAAASTATPKRTNKTNVEKLDAGELPMLLLEVSRSRRVNFGCMLDAPHLLRSIQTDCADNIRQQNANKRRAP